MPKVYKHFGALLHAIRETRSISLRGLARKLGVSEAYLSKVERGLHPPFTMFRLFDAADALHTHPVPLLLAAAKDRRIIEFPANTDDKRIAAALLILFADEIPKETLVDLVGFLKERPVPHPKAADPRGYAKVIRSATALGEALRKRHKRRRALQAKAMDSE